MPKCVILFFLERAVVVNVGLFLLIKIFKSVSVVTKFLIKIIKLMSKSV